MKCIWMMGDDIVSLDARAVQATVSVVSRVGLADLARLAPWDKGRRRSGS